MALRLMDPMIFCMSGKQNSVVFLKTCNHFTHTQTYLCCEVRLIVLIVLVPTACGLGIFVSVDPSGQLECSK